MLRQAQDDVQWCVEDVPSNIVEVYQSATTGKKEACYEESNESKRLDGNTEVRLGDN